MFEGVAPEHLHRFILATAAANITTATTTNPPTTTSTLPPPLSSSSSSSASTNISLPPSPHLPLHLSFTSPSQSPSPSPAAPAVFPLGFDPYQVPPPTFYHPLNNTTNSDRSSIKNHHDDREQLMAAFVIPNQQHQQKQKILVHHHHDGHDLDQAWSNEEVLSLLRIRSSMELNWFPPEFTWEHVSRKLAEIGFKRSPEKCRQKFEEETRFLHTIHNTTHNHHSYFPNHGDNGCINQQQQNKYDPHGNAEIEQQQQQQQQAKANQPEGEIKDQQDRPMVASEEDNVDHPSTSSNGNNDVTTPEFPVVTNSIKRKRRREDDKEEEEKFEMFKGLCQEIVDKMMAQQEEMQNKLIEDMVKRDQEKLAWEDAWKKREMDRINHELQLRADEQALAGDRQASIIKFLENFTTSTTNTAVTNPAAPQPEILAYQIKTLPTTTGGENDDYSTVNGNQNSTSSSSSAANLNNNSSLDQLDTVPPKPSTSGGELGGSSAKKEVGKRWPRDEVLALINLRCGIHNQSNNNNNNTNAGSNEIEGSPAAAGSNGGNNKVPLWERISRGMAELGYMRSAKRCKEKWENINKYFRKTKDLNKKRSVDSRTCPYFHQLSTLYGAAASEEEEEGTKKPGRDCGEDDKLAAGNGTSSAAEIVSAPATESFDYEF